MSMYTTNTARTHVLLEEQFAGKIQGSTPCRPSTGELIKRNRQEWSRYEILKDALLVLDDQGDWELRELSGFTAAYLAAVGYVELKLSGLSGEFEALEIEQAKEPPPPSSP